MDQPTASWKKFFVQLEGKTNGAHQDFVTKLQAVGHTEVKSLEESDYLLVFCPIVSRVGTDINEALEKIPDDKPTILVVMHHTFDPHRVIAESRRLVDKANVTTVDCLFYEAKLLKCERNENAWSRMQKRIGVRPKQISNLESTNNDNTDTCTGVTPDEVPSQNGFFTCCAPFGTLWKNPFSKSNTK